MSRNSFSLCHRGAIFKFPSVTTGKNVSTYLFILGHLEEGVEQTSKGACTAKIDTISSKCNYSVYLLSELTFPEFYFETEAKVDFP